MEDDNHDEEEEHDNHDDDTSFLSPLSSNLNIPPPKDRFYIIYITILIMSTTSIFPSKGLYTAIDYFQFLYPNFRSEVAIPFSINFSTLIGIMFTVSTVHLLPLYCRIGFTSVIYFIGILFITLLDIGIYNCTIEIKLAFALTMLTVAAVGTGVGIQLSSIFGLSSMLPKEYTQGTAGGVAVAGVITCIGRIITKASFNEERVGAIAFFVLALIMVIVGGLCQVILYHSKFVRYYIEKGKISKTDSEEDNNKESTDGIEMISFSDKQLLAQSGPPVSIKHRMIGRLKDYLFVIKRIWKMMFSIFFTYTLSLMIFPGLLSEVQYCTIGDWVPILMISLFSITDPIGRWLTLIPFKWRPNWLIITSISRFILIFALVLCIAPSPTYPLIKGAIWVTIAVAIILGITHGYMATISLIIASTLVEESYKEMSGTLMTFLFQGGATVGGAIAYAITPLTRIDTYIPCYENYTAEFRCLLMDNNEL